MAVIYHYRVTKYDPALRDGTGAIFRDDWTAISDIGKTFAGVRLTLPTYLEVEAHHLVALASFMEESDTSRVRAEGVENSFGTFRVSEGAELSPVEAVEVVRQMLREGGWCRLWDDDRFYIQVGWDYDLYVGTDTSCERSVAMAQERGLFVDDMDSHPWLDDD